MAVFSSQDLAPKIQWVFQLVEAGNIVRYGALGATYYRQLLPGGIEFVQRYPPKVIDQRLFDMASRQHAADAGLRS